MRSRLMLLSALVPTALLSTALFPLVTLVGCVGQVSPAPDDGSPLGRIYADAQGQALSYPAALQASTLGQGDLTVILVVDRSGSMDTPWDGSTKWDITRASLEQAIVGVEQDVTVGALFFPVGEECAVPPLSDPRQFQLQRGDLFQARLSSLGEATGGGTPMVQAFEQADAAVQQAISDGALAGRLRVVLLTDGEPNCGGDGEALVARADAWRAAGVEVFVMGLPGTEQARVLLDRIAGKLVVPGAPETPQDTSWEVGEQGGGAAIAPETQEDVDHSLEAAVR